MNSAVIILGIFGIVAIFVLWVVKHSTPQSAQKPNVQPQPQPQQIKKPAPPSKPVYKEMPEYIQAKKLTYNPNSNQLIYVENEYNEEINLYIQQKYDAICQYFRSRGYEFCYIPRLIAKLNNNAIIRYYAPYASTKRQVANDFLVKRMAENIRLTLKPSLMVCHTKDDTTQDGIYIFAIYPLESNISVDESFAHIIDFIERRKQSYTPSIQYSLRDNHKLYNYVMAEYPDSETKRLIDEIETRVAQLAQKGIKEHILQQIVATPQVVSRMVITRDYRIILPDYNNMEIMMTPLVKAVYLLFLRHPEGIVFKHLIDYRNELKIIYQQIKGESLDDKMNRSIEDITNPMRNSINEKCARIREAFVTRFDERLAVNYIVSGERGEPKCIPLHREFVEWQ